MSSKKRREENQLTKDIYEAGDYDSFGSKGGGGGGESSMASAEELKKRRIVKAVNPTKNSDGSSKKASNPFASVNFAASAPKATPFFFPNFKSSTPGPGTTAATTVDAAPATAPKLSVSFGSPAASNNFKDFQKKESKKLIVRKCRDLEKELYDHLKKQPVDANWLCIVDQFMNTFFQLEKKFYDSEDESDNNGEIKEEPKKEQQPVLGGFSFGGSTPTKRKSEESPAASEKPSEKRAFSFSTPGFGGSTANATSASAGATPFVFGAAPSTTPGVPATPATPATPGDEPTEDDSAPSVISKNADPDWKDIHEAKVAIYHYRNNNTPTRFAGGPMRFQEHKTTSKRRMVLRNLAGKVQINIQISKDMSFKSSIKKTKIGAQVENIVFFGLNFDSGDKAEMFTIRAGAPGNDEPMLKDRLEQMAAMV